MKPIVLSVKRTQHRRDDPRSHEKDRAYQQARPKVLERDDHTCQFCDIRIPGDVEVHHMDGDHGHNDLKNLITACRLCHLAHHIGFVGVEKAGILVRLPGIQQAELNHLLRTLWIGEESKLITVKDQCSSLLRTLLLSAQGAEALLGYTDPKLLGDRLLRASDEEYKRRISFLKDIKIIYNRENFADHIKAVSDIYSGYPVARWSKIAEAFAAEA